MAPTINAAALHAEFVPPAPRIARVPYPLRFLQRVGPLLSFPFDFDFQMSVFLFGVSGFELQLSIFYSRISLFPIIPSKEPAFSSSP
jgi:hypothetical protein